MLQGIVRALNDALPFDFYRYGFFVILAVYCRPLSVPLHGPSQPLQLQLQICPFHIKIKYLATCCGGQKG